MTQDATTIRQFRAADADSVVALWREAVPTQQPWNEPAEILLRKLNVLDDLVIVAEQKNFVVGAVLGGYDGVRGWIYSLAVSPNYRRQGIGQQLLARAESVLLSQSQFAGPTNKHGGRDVLWSLRLRGGRPDKLRETADPATTTPCCPGSYDSRDGSSQPVTNHARR